jgi:hypothetical protein
VVRGDIVDAEALVAMVFLNDQDTPKASGVALSASDEIATTLLH